MTFRELKRVMTLVEPYIAGHYCLGADKDELYIHVNPIPERVAETLEDMGVSLESGILSSGGTLTLFL